MSEIYNIEEVKDEFIKNTIQEYLQRYAQPQIDLAIYYLNDFVNNLVANELVLLKYEPEPEPTPQPIQQIQRPLYQPPMQQRMQQPQQYVPPRVAATPYQPPSVNPYTQNPFQEEEQVAAEYSDPRTQRMRVDDFSVQREVREMNEQLRTPQPPRQIQQPMQRPMQDINLDSEKSKTFVDKIKEMRNPRKKEGINPEE